MSATEQLFLKQKKKLCRCHKTERTFKLAEQNIVFTILVIPSFKHMNTQKRPQLLQFQLKQYFYNSSVLTCVHVTRTKLLVVKTNNFSPEKHHWG